MKYCFRLITIIGSVVWFRLNTRIIENIRFRAKSVTFTLNLKNSWRHHYLRRRHVATQLQQSLDEWRHPVDVFVLLQRLIDEREEKSGVLRVEYVRVCQFPVEGGVITAMNYDEGLTFTMSRFFI